MKTGGYQKWKIIGPDYVPLYASPLLSGLPTKYQLAGGHIFNQGIGVLLKDETSYPGNV